MMTRSANRQAPCLHSSCRSGQGWHHVREGQGWPEKSGYTPGAGECSMIRRKARSHGLAGRVTGPCSVPIRAEGALPPHGENRRASSPVMMRPGRVARTPKKVLSDYNPESAERFGNLLAMLGKFHPLWQAREHGPMAQVPAHAKSGADIARQLVQMPEVVRPQSPVPGARRKPQRKAKMRIAALVWRKYPRQCRLDQGLGPHIGQFAASCAGRFSGGASQVMSGVSHL